MSVRQAGRQAGRQTGTDVYTCHAAQMSWSARFCIVSTAQHAVFGRADDTVGNPHRAQIPQFELFEFTMLLKVDKQLYIEQFETTVSDSAVPSHPLRCARLEVCRALRRSCLGFTIISTTYDSTIHTNKYIIVQLHGLSA